MGDISIATGSAEGFSPDPDWLVDETCERDTVVETPEIVGFLRCLRVVWSLTVDVAEFLESDAVALDHSANCCDHILERVDRVAEEPTHVVSHGRRERCGPHWPLFDPTVRLRELTLLLIDR
ncbi:hypothetical protein [Haloarcula pelagica]|uniref:hypothetical protein n=1 Tax=Halomicroarcula sp. GCM10025709 TaxID=3252669 RepID=UPI0036D348B2